MRTVEVRQKIAEAETWLKCDCPICQAMRKGLGKGTIKRYIARLKAEAEKRQS